MRSPLEWHNDQEINIRIPQRLSVGVRAKQYYLFRAKLDRYLLAEAVDLSGRCLLEVIMSRSLHVIPRDSALPARRPDYMSSPLKANVTECGGKATRLSTVLLQPGEKFKVGLSFTQSLQQKLHRFD